MQGIRFAHSGARGDEFSGGERDHAGADEEGPFLWTHEGPLDSPRAEEDQHGGESAAAEEEEEEEQEAHWVARAIRRAGERQVAKRSSHLDGARYANQRLAPRHAHGPVQCLPAPDAFQPCRDLFDSIWLRASVWLVFLLAFLGNISVIVVLGSVRPSSSTSALTSIMWFNAAHSKRHIDVPRFLVLNLALADLLMACYLGILVLVDLSTLGEFRLHAIRWQHSAGCKLAGFLAILSSELSVFILAIITLERNYAITNAVHLNRRLSLQKAMVIMLFGYLYALAMALMPLNGINDYRQFSVCLPLQFEPHKTLLESGSNLYLVLLVTINTLSFVLLLSCYLRMYCAIRGSQAWNTNDLKIAKRMSILVVTDFLCWSPIICLGVGALLGRHLVGPDGLKVLVIFVLPLNSVANPFLYAITTKKFKRDLAILKKRLRLEQAWQRITLAGSYLACGWRKHKPPGTSGSLGRAPMAAAMEQIYYRRGKRDRLDGSSGSKLMMASVQAIGTNGNRRPKSKLSRQELPVMSNHHNNNNNNNNNNDQRSRLAASSGRTATSRLVRLNQQQFQSFERNQDFAVGPAEVLTSRTHCLACQRRLVAAGPVTATASALEPTTLNSAPRRPEPEVVDSERSREHHRGRPDDALAGQRELSYLLERTSCTRPRIVLDAVEPVVGVAMAPLRLVDGRRELPAGPPTQLTAPDSSRANSHSRAPSSLELGAHLAPDGTSDAESAQQPRASSADNQPARGLRACLTHLSCQTVLVSDKLTTRSVLAPGEILTPASQANRSVSACAFVWPTATSGGSKWNRLEPAPNREIYDSTCHSCSCDMTRLGVSRQSSGLTTAATGAAGRSGRSGLPEVRIAKARMGRSRRSDTECPKRARSINRLVFEPLAKAWSNLQLSLQSGLGGSGAGQHPDTSASQQNRSSSRQQLARLGSNRNQDFAPGPGRVGQRESRSNSSASSERHQLVLDEHEESAIIEDVLQMSSPARRRLLSGRRMSRSCDVIIEQSYASTGSTSGNTAEPTTSSSHYDQNDDQRILLATINQLSARRKRRRGQRRNNESAGVGKRAGGRLEPLPSDKKASFTRCRSWSPALLDKLEDCMYQIKSRIPGFNTGRELQRVEASFEALESKSSSNSSRSPGAAAAAAGDLGREHGDFQTASQSSSRSSSSGAMVEGEEDEFNEASLVEWARNMQRKAPSNCYAKSATSRHRLRQQLSGNSDTLSGRTIGTTLTSVSFDSSSNIPATITSLGATSSGSNRHSDEEEAGQAVGQCE